MIKQITDSSLLWLSDSYYGGKIAAYAEAYGLNYDFCRFYRLKNGTLMINNSNCVIDGRPPVNEELRFFIKMNGISAVESPLDIRIGGYTRHMRTVFEIKPCGGNINETDIRRNSGFEEIYSVLNGSFGDIPHDGYIPPYTPRRQRNFFLPKDRRCTGFCSLRLWLALKYNDPDRIQKLRQLP